MTDNLIAAIPGDRTLLIVEDDKSFIQRLAKAMESRGFVVTTAETVADVRFVAFVPSNVITTTYGSPARTPAAPAGPCSRMSL